MQYIFKHTCTNLLHSQNHFEESIFIIDWIIVSSIVWKPNVSLHDCVHTTDWFIFFKERAQRNLKGGHWLVNGLHQEKASYKMNKLCYAGNIQVINLNVTHVRSTEWYILFVGGNGILDESFNARLYGSLYSRWPGGAAGMHYWPFYFWCLLL